MMDFKGLVFLLIVLVNVVCATLIAATQEDPDGFNQVASSGSALSWKRLEQNLREDIEQELEDIREYEQELKNKYYKMQNKKRQLEIRKRQPVQCLVNIVSCWRRRK